MNYFLNKYFLYESPNVTSISIVLDESLEEGKASLNIISNKRECVIKYNGDVPYSYFSGNPFFTIRATDKLLKKMDSQPLKTTAETLINGIKYYSSEDVGSLNVILTDDGNTKVISSIVEEDGVEGDDVTIIVPSVDNYDDPNDYCYDDPNAYCDGINSLGINVYCKVVDKDKFVVSNINTVQMDRVNVFDVNNTYISKFTDFVLTEDIIISEFIDSMKTSPKGEFDDYEICASLSDIVSRTQKHKWLVVTGHMADALNETYSTHARIHPVYGHYCQVVITVGLEWIFDDFSTFQYERDNLIIGSKWDDFTCYAITDPLGFEWRYSVDWNFVHRNGWSDDVTRNPVGKYLSDKPLYSIRGECKIIGWMIEKLDDTFGRIEETRYQTYMSILNDSGTAVFVNNTAFKILAEVYSDGNPLLKKCKEYYIYELEFEVYTGDSASRYVCLGNRETILDQLVDTFEFYPELVGDGVIIVASEKQIDEMLDGVVDSPGERYMARTSNHSLYVSSYNNYNLLWYVDDGFLVCKRQDSNGVLDSVPEGFFYPYSDDQWVGVDIRGKLPPYFGKTNAKRGVKEE